MAGFRFKIAELERETKTLKTMGKRFIDSQTSWTLDLFSSNLQSIRGERGENARALELQGLRTTPSNQYEAGSRRGGQKIHAVISGIWEVRPLGNRPASGRKIEFCGNASTKVELYASDDPETRLAMWRMELGAEDSPGCYVHAQILGDSNQPPFPKSVPIPRLPSIFVTPMSAVEEPTTPFTDAQIEHYKTPKAICPARPSSSARSAPPAARHPVSADRRSRA